MGDGLGKALLQHGGEIAHQIFDQLGIVRQVGGQQLLIEGELGIGEQTASSGRVRPWRWARRILMLSSSGRNSM